MSEEEVIRRRLIFDGDGTGEDRRLNLLLKMITNWVKTDESDEIMQAKFDKILVQLSIVEHSKHRYQYVSKSNSVQLEKYQTLHSTMEEEIDKKKNEIDLQRKELVKAKVIKHNRIQYDLLAKAIAKEPPRTIMNKKLKVLQKELADLATEKKLLESKLDSRKRQFNVLSTSANALAALLTKNEKLNGLMEISSDTLNLSGPEPMSE
ncbi:hypothetical protein GWI33_019262 [Rhynchophorus ferrugineus]|uniref:THO complex subunit 7 homolog n=1 Tax=Rhynchophorus ferrugineus TaxID=354439 RepID=A0A834M0M7_RHYFE|nr:hypothetical protein GWI33_019262 [Rhynchophorus ferrugineus]